MLDLSEIQAWRKRNFPTATATDQLLGVGEEVGELMHHHLKDSQNIRGTHEEHVEGMRDAVGDILIYLEGYCHIQGWDMMEIFRHTINHVLKRDWITDPVAGGENPHLPPDYSTAIDLLKENDGDPSWEGL